METRNTGREGGSLPLLLTEFVAKRESAVQRRSEPICPKLETKYLKRKIAERELTASHPKSVYFNNPVTLSQLYVPEKDLTYFDQIFSMKLKIGEGSFGEVFKACSREDNRLYAIKQMKNVHGVKYGFEEVKNYEKVGQHSTIVKFFMAWEEVHVVHIQMEYCSMSLAQYSTIANNSITETQLWEIMFDILNALGFLHKKKLIHLDVKPGNIMMNRGYYKLGDFGCLVDLNQQRKLSTISDGDAKYLASEVLSGIYTFAADIFGLGISLLELAVDIELPASGPLWQKIRAQSIPTVWYSDKGISHTFSAISQKMMSSIHWQRPTAAKILRMASLKQVLQRDQEFPRTIYGSDDDNVIGDLNVENNNNVVDTPRRPLHEIRNPLIRHSINDTIIRDLATPKVVDSSEELASRRGLIRTRLAF